MRIYPLSSVFYLCLLPLLFGGCTHEAQVAKPVSIIFKTPKLRFADQGFLSVDDSRAILQLYSAGSALGRMEVNRDSVCIDTLCMSGEQFTDKYLNGNLPPQTLYDIFSKNPIGTEGVVLSEKDGFMQRFWLPDGLAQFVTDKNSSNFHYSDITINIKELQ